MPVGGGGAVVRVRARPAVPAHPAPPRRLRMFDRLPAVLRDPERYRPALVTAGDPHGAAVPRDWVAGGVWFERGDEGERVSTLQRALARARHDPGPPDGDFGPRTEDAVRAFQRVRGLAVDGLAGPQTLGELTAPLLRRFLAGLEDVLDPVLATLDNLPGYVSVDTAPDDVLTWLAWVVGADTMEEWGRDRRRVLVARALELNRSRGTVPGIAAVVALHLDLPPEDVTVTDGGETSWDLDPDAPLRTDPDRTVRVTLPGSVGELSTPTRERLRVLLAPSLPVGFAVDVVVRGSSSGGAAAGGGARDGGTSGGGAVPT